MKKTTKIILSTLIAIFAITLTNSVNANYQIIYQENANNYLKKTGDTFINTIRDMEANGQVMGLSETHDNTTLLSTSGSNYIDVHLQKNTEYGAMILLSASTKYGKQAEEDDTTALKESRFVRTGTTTGNSYGVYMNQANVSNTESNTLTAAGFTYDPYNRAYNLAINSKYVNRYASENTRLPGDALLSWHNGNTWTTGYVGIVRGRTNSVFTTECNYKAATNYGSFFGRAAFVCGEGF